MRKKNGRKKEEALTLSSDETVSKTDEEWQKILTPEQYRVCRKKDTERPFTGKYNDCKENGMYKCSCCGNELFDSNSKFESNNSLPQHEHLYIPFSLQSLYFPVNGLSVSFFLQTLYCSGVRIFCHSSSVFETVSSDDNVNASSFFLQFFFLIQIFLTRIFLNLQTL